MYRHSKQSWRLKIIPLAFASVLSIGAMQTVHAETMTFKQIVERTLVQNPNMMVSQARIEQAQAALAKAENSRMPQIKLSVTGSVSDNPLNVFGMKLQQRQATFADFGANTFFETNDTSVAPDELNNPGTHTDLNTRLEMLIPVWSGGKIGLYQEQAKAMIRAAEGGDEATKQFLIFNVFKAFEAVHAARAYINVAEQAKKTADEFVRTTRNLVEQGVVVRSELLSAQVNQSNADVALMKVQEHEQMALDGLKILMNMDLSEPLDVADRVDFDMQTMTVEKIVEQAIANNPELNALREQIVAENQSVEVARSEKLPSFNVMLRQDWNDENIGFGSSSYTVAGVAAWTLTDFGVTDNSIAMARAAAAQKKAQMQAKENEIRMNIYTAWRTLNVAKIQVTSSDLAVKQATQAQELIKRRFESGVATITEVLASQTQLDKANADLVNAQYEVKIQQAQLRLLSGMIDLNQI